MKNKYTIPLLTIPLVILFLSYTLWNSADPESSCAICHEISLSVETSQYSSHREILCVECHGTALSNGLHSLSEKTSMLLTHLSPSNKNKDISLNENQIIEIMGRCKNCHQTQFADWRSSGHSATYAEIFLNEEHNKMETPYSDCFRCHGMFFDGDISDLMDPVDNKGPWKFKTKDRANLPTMPCLTCHQIHLKNNQRSKTPTYSDPKSIFYNRKERNVPYGLYMRADKSFLRADKLLNIEITNDNNPILTSGEFSQRLCIQCHSPNYLHEAGSSDDRTPIGVHEGLACRSCHSPHSNDSKKSCDDCHPAISNCGLDVKKMNTTYLNADSPFNIHFVSCKDCHKKMSL